MIKKALLKGFIPIINNACKTSITNELRPNQAILHVNIPSHILNNDQNNEVSNKHHITSDGENLLYISPLPNTSTTKKDIVNMKESLKGNEKPLLYIFRINIPKIKYATVLILIISNSDAATRRHKDINKTMPKELLLEGK